MEKFRAFEDVMDVVLKRAVYLASVLTTGELDIAGGLVELVWLARYLEVDLLEYAAERGIVLPDHFIQGVRSAAFDRTWANLPESYPSGKVGRDNGHE